jgi:hypothetical protein
MGLHPGYRFSGYYNAGKMANLIRVLVRPRPTFTKILRNAYPLRDANQRTNMAAILGGCSRFAEAIDGTGSYILPGLMDCARILVSQFEATVSVDYEADDDTAITSLLHRALLRCATWSTNVDVVNNNRKVSVRQTLRGADPNKEFDGLTTQPCTHDLQLDNHSQSEALTVRNRFPR